MHRKPYVAIGTLVLVVSGCAHATSGQMAFPDGVVQHVVRAGGIEWKPCPPDLPAGCEIAVLEGDPRSPGLFSVRFRVEEGVVIPAHTHPNDERVTILEGKVSVGFGRDGSRADAKQFGPGDYYVNRRGAVHAVWIDETAVLQITGMGPWQARFVDETRAEGAP